MNNTDAYLKGWVDKYGEVLLRAGLDEQIIDHFIVSGLSRAQDEAHDSSCEERSKFPRTYCE